MTQVLCFFILKIAAAWREAGIRQENWLKPSLQMGRKTTNNELWGLKSLCIILSIIQMASSLATWHLLLLCAAETHCRKAEPAFQRKGRFFIFPFCLSLLSVFCLSVAICMCCNPLLCSKGQWNSSPLGYSAKHIHCSTVFFSALSPTDFKFLFQEASDGRPQLNQLQRGELGNHTREITWRGEQSDALHLNP